MAEYKCICCGKTMSSDAACGCPDCGYRMFPTPYHRKELLAAEIKRFISRLRLEKVTADDLIIFRETKKKDDAVKITLKKEDDNQFPSFEKIRSYVCAAQKTEEFIDRFNASVNEIRKHLHEPVSIQYQVGTDPLQHRIEAYDSVLKSAIGVLKIKETPSELIIPEIKLDYGKEPVESLGQLADELADLLIQLSAKLKSFIKINNIYGTAYRKTADIKKKTVEDQDPEELLRKAIQNLNSLIARRFVVDIFADGSDEICTMTKAAWQAIYLLMNLPIQRIKENWIIPDHESVFGDAIYSELPKAISGRYCSLDKVISDASWLSGADEDECFDFYTKMIGLDEFDLMGVDSSSLRIPGEYERKLNKLIGLSGIKESIKKIKAYALSNRDKSSLNIHMCFYGNPGTGKTEVARYIAGILYENKILPKNKVVEVDRSGLIGQFVGETPIKTMEKIEEAMGGVLFVDEAYALVSGSGNWDYGHEAVATLIKAMEDYRGKFCVILAGYRNQMQEMLKSNPGFKSRIQFELDFPNYSREEMQQIGTLMAEHHGYSVSENAMNRMLDITDIKRKEADFANAREMRNVLDQVIMCQNIRTLGSGNHELAIVDVNKYITDAKINLPTTGIGSAKKLLTGEDELDQLIGLTAIKRMVKKIKAYAKRNSQDPQFNLHMCFYGNPGTGKTEVARILSRVLYDAGVLAEAKVVETDSTGLLGQFVGETGPKTEKKVKEAMGGVLFIDEAYGLVNTVSSHGTNSGYGDEAIAVLLKQMEDHRGQFCTILAGYKDEMKQMLDSNPGFLSRIQFTLDFPDYTREELGEIAVAFLQKKKYTINDEALGRLLDVAEYYRNQPSFANARTIRNILDQVIMNQNLRAEDAADDYLIILDDVNDYITDEGLDLSKTGSSKRRIGF